MAAARTADTIAGYVHSSILSFVCCGAEAQSVCEVVFDLAHAASARSIVETFALGGGGGNPCRLRLTGPAGDVFDYAARVKAV